MNNSNIGAIILGAGKGSRMKSDLPKVMMPIDNKPMISHILNTLESMDVKKIVTIIAPDGQIVAKQTYPYDTAVQDKQLGTGHAVACAKESFENFKGQVLVIFGDTPLITKNTFEQIVNEIKKGFGVVVLGFKPDDAARYGRLIMNNNELEAIVEYKDATDNERAINFCNSGCMGFDGKYLFEILSKIDNHNAANEYYLTDAIKVAKSMGLKCSAIEGNPKEVASANTLEELALLEQLYKESKNW